MGRFEASSPSTGAWQSGRSIEAGTAEAGIRDLDELLVVGGVRCIAVDDEQARSARDAFARFGKGRSSAGLNFGDCFSYALARATNRPPLFKGEDFSETDVTPAINERGGSR
jgi:ribonuclease VapC